MAPSKMPLDPHLLELARAFGVLIEYDDYTGSPHETDREVLEQILAVFGVPAADDAAQKDCLEAERAVRWGRVLEPVSVAWDGKGTLAARTPSGLEGRSYRIEVVQENGAVLSAAGVFDGEVLKSTEISGTTYALRALALPDGITHGYHRVRLHIGARTHDSLLIAAPERVFVPVDDPKQGRHWGLFLPLYAVRKPEGMGDLSDLESMIAWTAQRGGSVVGTLPLLAAFLDEPFEPSPYVPASRLFWNELFLDVGKLPELEVSPAARSVIAAKERLDALRRLDDSEHVDYAAQMALKRPILEVLSKTLMTSKGERREKFESYLANNPRLDDYACFRAATEKRKLAWRQWSGPAFDGNLAAGDYRPADRDYHRYVQFSLHEQMSALSTSARQSGLGLYLDLPVGVSGIGYDPWRERDMFTEGVTNGAPPDLLFSEGQNWGFNPLHPDRIRDDEYRYFIAMIRNHCRYAGVLRIDHVMGLHRLFWIPEGRGAKEGVYVHYNAEELYAILSLESHRSKTVLCGENLGTVPPAVDEAMERHGVQGMHVMQFGLTTDPNDAIMEPTPGSVASINTHDTPTFAAFMRGLDVDRRVHHGWLAEDKADVERSDRSAVAHAVERQLRKEGLTKPGEGLQGTLRGALQVMGSSDASLVLVNMEDLWSETEPQNVPGTGPAQRPANWHQRAKHGVDALEKLPGVTETIEVLEHARRGVTTEVAVSDVEHDAWGIGEDQRHLFNEGSLIDAYNYLGAHVVEHDGVRGTRFSVWAPNAKKVSVIGEFNDWQGGQHELQARYSSGIWEGFIGGVLPGALYKYEITSHENGVKTEKADPYGLLHEEPPKTASVVWELDYEWSDDAWMSARREAETLNAPMSIYEVHLGSWMRNVEEGGRSLTYRELAPRLAAHVKELGFTHVELLPIMEHPFYGSWGYQITGYFAPSARYGTPQDFMFLVDHLHQQGIGVLLDWVPSHFPNDAHGLVFFDGTHLYEHADPRKGFHPDWNSCIFNYGRNEVRSFLLSNALFWLDKYHIDGLRVDAVASMLYLDYSRKQGEWIPNEHGGRENLEAISLLKRLNEEIYGRFPGVQTIAEESTAWEKVSRPTSQGGLGFGMKWDMGWMHDTLRYLSKDPVHRKHHHKDVTFRLLYAFNENFVLSLSHDEVVHMKGSLINKMPGDVWQKQANLRLMYGYMYGQPGKKLLFMGQEFGQWSEWNHESSLDWHLLEDAGHRGIQTWLGHLNSVYREHPALSVGDFARFGFEWVDHSDAENSVISFMRKTRDGQRPVVVVCNFTPMVRHDYRVGVPHPGRWVEIANSDQLRFGGSGVENGHLESQPRPWQNQPHSVCMNLPPLGVVFLSGA